MFNIHFWRQYPQTNHLEPDDIIIAQKVSGKEMLIDRRGKGTLWYSEQLMYMNGSDGWGNILWSTELPT